MIQLTTFQEMARRFPWVYQKDMNTHSVSLSLSATLFLLRLGEEKNNKAIHLKNPRVQMRSHVCPACLMFKWPLLLERQASDRETQRRAVMQNLWSSAAASA